MLVEFLLEVFFIKIKIKGYLENITENTKEFIDTFGINNKNKISYIIDNTKYKLDIFNDKIILTRETEEFIHGMIFKLNQETTTEYYMKKINSSLSLKLLTTKLEINKLKIEINYKVLDNDNEYIYLIEMSEK